jgi:predicted metal-dependent phosphotriesterase family hydrolase
VGDVVIQTVLGPIPASEAGLTLAHEHVLIDAWDMTHSYDGILDDEGLAIAELLALSAAGGRTIVDCTSMGLGRDPLALARVSRASGLNIVMGTGWYRAPVYPPMVRESSAEELAEVIVGDLTLGVPDSDGIRAGFIGEIGTERGRIAAAEERVFRAAALAQQRTGVAIVTHTTNAGDLALEQVALLTGLGVSAERIVVSHVGDRITPGRLDALAGTGVFLSIDNIGYEGGGYPPDAVRADHVARLVRAGHAERVLISGDTCTRSALLAYGGAGYARVITDFVPRLRERGLDDSDIETLLVANPARALGVESTERVPRTGPWRGPLPARLAHPG